MCHPLDSLFHLRHTFPFGIQISLFHFEPISLGKICKIFESNHSHLCENLILHSPVASWNKKNHPADTLVGVKIHLAPADTPVLMKIHPQTPHLYLFRCEVPPPPPPPPPPPGWQSSLGITCTCVSFYKGSFWVPEPAGVWTSLGLILLKQGLALISVWISNHMPSKVWNAITYPFTNFNNCTVEVWE